MKNDWKQTAEMIRENPGIASALEMLEKWHEESLGIQMELCAIRSPSNHEEKRARRFFELMSGIGLDKVYMDEVNNVIGVRKGSGTGPAIVIAAHMDTVFGPEVDCTPVKRDDGLIWGPGICDDTRGMTEVYMIARAVCEADIRAVGDIFFVGNVGEESVGDLRGTKALFSSGLPIGAFISIDGPQAETLVISAIAGYKYRFTYRGRGGHALGAFGIPNVNNAIGYAAAKIAAMQVPEEPLTVFNIGVIRGGVSVNAIPSEAEMMVDLRSMSVEELEKMNGQVLAAVREACVKENARWNHPTERITLDIELVSSRPGGTQPDSAPIVQAALAAYEAFGMKASIPKGSSTDANVPISMGIPAVAVGRGGVQFDGHTVNERFNPEKAYLGPQRDLVFLFMLAGLAGVTEPVIR